MSQVTCRPGFNVLDGFWALVVVLILGLYNLGMYDRSNNGEAMAESSAEAEVEAPVQAWVHVKAVPWPWPKFKLRPMQPFSGPGLLLMMTRWHYSVALSIRERCILFAW